MKYNGRKPYRRSIRLKNYDYTQPNAYFITVCTQNRACFFGEIVADELNATTAAEIVLAEWHELPKRFANVQIDAFVIMPNHIHGILWILPTDTQTPTKPDAMNRIPTHRQPTVEAQFIAPSSIQTPTKPDAINRIPTHRQPTVEAQFIAPSSIQTPTKPDAMNRIPTHTQPPVEAQFIAPSSIQTPTKSDAINRIPTHRQPPVEAQFIAPSYTQEPAKPDAMNRIPTHRQPPVEAQFIAPSYTQEPAKPDAMNRISTLGDILRTFKSAATRRIRQQGFSDFAWQSNYYEHIIRNETSLANIRNYIINNPLQWSLDNENPAHL